MAMLLTAAAMAFMAPGMALNDASGNFGHQAFNFNGSSYVQTPASGTSLAAFTWSLWFNVKSVAGENPGFIDAVDDTSGYVDGASPGGIEILSHTQFNDPLSTDSLYMPFMLTPTYLAAGTGGNFIGDGIWHHVALTWDGSNFQVFIDSVPVRE